MKFILIFFILIFLNNCNKPKTVLICGDHICINKAEARQYFEDNLSIEVKIIDKESKKNNEIDLVELNLRNIDNNKKEIKIFSKRKTSKNIKVLTKNEKEIIKKKLKNKNKSQKVKRDIKKVELKSQINKNIKNNFNKKIKNLDICKDLENCDIDKISDFLIKEAKKKSFPDITIRKE